MPRKKIHLIKAAQVKPFINTASRLGVPVKALARQVDLPLWSVEKGEGVIGEHSAWRFLELASSYPNCGHLGYLTALDHPVTHTSQLGGMTITTANSLRSILEIFCHEVVTESDSCNYRLVSQGRQTWFTRKLVITESGDGWQPELYVLTFIIQIVRLCAPGDWLPKKIRIATRQLPEKVPAEWNSIDIDWGWHRTELLLDERVLFLPPRFVNDHSRTLPTTADAEKNEMVIQDIVDRQIWSKHIGLDNAARELGMSRATLKRRLDAMNTSYSAILGERRLRHAARLIESSDMSVKEIAEKLSYSAVSNFSRAFSKATRTSPSNWRKHSLVRPDT
ncbi:MAG: helix-turn-helix transcriptional regulator [Gammaproteobacteria bacterium]|nr:helix-turn-helix transcriptional regulator [Gammaproteobacteria bacterium]